MARIPSLALLAAAGVVRWWLGGPGNVNGRLRRRSREVAALLADAREREERLRFLYEDNPSMYFTVARDGTVLSANRFGANYLGYTPEELEGRSVFDVVHEEDHDRVRRHLEGCLHNPRAEAGRLEIEDRPLDVGEFVASVAAEYEAQAQAAGLDLKVRVANAVPVIRSDAGRIRQILGNLISNAVKYTEQGVVTVRVEAHEDGGALGPGRWVCVAVSDTGPGIPPEKQELLFQEYGRLEPDGKGGAGLGLAISRRLAELLGGGVSVSSEVGVGSTFTLWLPCA